MSTSLSPTTTLPPPTPTVAAPLALVDVRHRYGEVEVLHGIDLAVAAGELVAVVGPSGSGKTTLLATAGGLLAPSSGSVRITGRDLYPGGEVDEEVRRATAFVLQAASTIPFLTVEEHLFVRTVIDGGRVGADERLRAADLLGAVDLAAKARRFPADLSGGERQRVCVAQALATGAPILLADEPTASLDRARGRDVMALLADHAHDRGAAVLVSTHDERALDLADRVVTVEDGRLID